MGFLERQEAEAYFAQGEKDTLQWLERYKSHGEAAVLVKEDAFHCETLAWVGHRRDGIWMRPDKGDSWWLKTLWVKQVPEGKSQDAGAETEDLSEYNKHQ